MAGIEQAIGSRVRKLREKKGLSQEAFGDLCDISRSHMGEIERGEKAITSATLWKLVRGLEITFSKFFSRIEKDLGPPEAQKKLVDEGI